MKSSVLLNLGLLCLLVLLIPIAAHAGGTPAGTVIKNVASVAYKDSAGNPFPTVYSDTSSVTVEQKAGLVVYPSGYNKIASDSMNVYFPVRATNTGNGTDSYALALVNQHGWVSALYADADSNGVPDNGTAITSITGLAEDQNFYFVLKVFVPNGTSSSVVDTSLITVTSAFDNTVKGYQHDTISTKVAQLTPSKSAAGGSTTTPGATISYTLSYTNAGTGAATNAVMKDVLPSTVTFNNDASASVGSATFSSDTITWTIGSVAGGGTGTLTFSVLVKDSVASGTSITNTATLTYQDSIGGNRPKYPDPTPPVTKNVIQVPSWSLKVTVVGGSFTTNNAQDSINVGLTQMFLMKLKNTGNATDTASLFKSSSLPLTWTVYVDVNNNGTYDAGTDSVFHPSTDNTRGIAQNGEMRFLMRAPVPTLTADRSLDSAFYRFTSISSSANSSGYTKTRVKAPVLTMTKSAVLDNSHSRPGDTITYTITYTNSGSGVATTVVISDASPSQTTYVTNSVQLKNSGTGNVFLSRTDASDADEVAVSSGTVTASVGTVGGSFVGDPTYSGQIKFKVVIN